MKPQSQSRRKTARPAARASGFVEEPEVVRLAASSHPGTETESDDFFAHSEVRSRRNERRRQYDEARHAESVTWRSTRDRELELVEEARRPNLRLVDDVETEEPLSPQEEARFKRLVPRRRKLQPCHFGLLSVTLLLTALSIPLIYSASTPIAIDNYNGDANFFLIRQLMYVALGLAVMVTASRVAPEKLRTVVWVLFGVSVVGLLATKFSPLGYTMGNVERWVKVGPVTFQFSEMAKIALIGVMADFWSRAARDVQKSWWPWAAAAGLAIIPIGLVLIQPHLSAALVLMSIPLFIAIYAGAPWKHIGVLAVAAVMGLGLLIGVCKSDSTLILKEYQKQRILSHFGGDHAEDARGNGYQAYQGQRAIVNGGAFGLGPGASIFKQGHLPAPHTDFIYAVTAEEWGLIGSLGLLALFASAVFFCFQIGHSSKDGFEQLLCAGVASLIAVQVLGNVAVVSGLMPVTGIPLPFVTFGGSGLWCILGGLGLVLAVSRSQNDVEEAE